MNNQLKQIRGMLADLYQESAEAEQWLDTPQTLLDGAIPRELVECGNGERVIAMLQAVLDGAYL